MKIEKHMSVLKYFINDKDEQCDVINNENIDTTKELSPRQISKKNYMEKYRKTDKHKQNNRESFKKFYEANSKKIYEERRKKMCQEPELYERFKEQQRNYARKKREIKKTIEKK
jgi:hypothetical protein